MTRSENKEEVGAAVDDVNVATKGQVEPTDSPDAVDINVAPKGKLETDEKPTIDETLNGRSTSEIVKEAIFKRRSEGKNDYAPFFTKSGPIEPAEDKTAHQKTKRNLRLMMIAGIFSAFISMSAQWSNTGDVSRRVFLTSFVGLLVVVLSFFIGQYQWVNAAYTVNRRATVLILIGSSLFVIGSIFCTGRDLLWFNFMGFIVTTIGAVVFTMCSVIFRVWQMMVSAMIFSIGMFCYSISFLLLLLHPTKEQEENLYQLNVASASMVVFAMFGFIIKGYSLIKKPWLKVKNFLFYGALFYFSGAFISLLVAIEQLPNAHPNFGFGLTRAPILSSVCFLIGSFLFFLDAGQTELHVDSLLEEYFMSSMLITEQNFMKIAFKGGQVFLTGSVVLSMSLIFAQDSELYVLLFIGQMFLFIFGVFLTLVMAPRMNKNNSENNQTGGIEVKVFVGYLFISLGWFLKAALIIVYNFNDMYNEMYHDRVYDIMRIFGDSIISLGVILMLLRNLTGLYPLMVYNWLHPGNYFGWTWILCLFGQICFITSSTIPVLDERKPIDLFASLFWVLASMFYLFYLRSAETFVEIIDCAYEAKPEDYSVDKDAAANYQKKFDAKIEGVEIVQEINDIDVIVCGAGPAGMTLINDLGLRGIKAILIEQRAECISDARFFLLNPASLELLRRYGVMEDLLKISSEPDQNFGATWVNGLTQDWAEQYTTCYTPGRSVLQKNPSINDPVVYSRMMGNQNLQECPLRIMQSSQEIVLRKAAEKRAGIKVLYGHELLTYHNKEDGSVEVYIKRICEAPRSDDTNQIDDHPNVEDAITSYVEVGQVFKVNCRFLAACEGPGGPIAKIGGAKFDGFVNVRKTKSMLFRSPGLWEHCINKFGPAHQYQISKPGYGVLLLVPADPARGLWNCPLRFGPGCMTDKPLDVLKSFIGDKFSFQVLTSQHWYINFYAARDFRLSKGVFLCGDAAHSWPPFGGILGNTAYGDGVALGWRLAMILKGYASDGLLESYDYERRINTFRTGLYVIDCTVRPKMMLRAANFSKYRINLPWLKLRWLHANTGVHNHNHFAQSGVQLGSRYDFSSAVVHDPRPASDDPYCEYHPRVRAGARAPYCLIQNSSVAYLAAAKFLKKKRFNETNIFDELSTECYTMFYFLNKTDETFAKRMMINHFVHTNVEKIQEFFMEQGTPLHCVEIQCKDLQINTGGYLTAANLYMETGLVIVRPDRYIAYSIPVLEINELKHEEVYDMYHTLCGTGLSRDSFRRKLRQYHHSEILLNHYKAAMRPMEFVYAHAIRVKGEIKEKVTSNVVAAKNKRETETVKDKVQNKGIILTNKTVGLCKGLAASVSDFVATIAETAGYVSESVAIKRYNVETKKY